MTKSYRVLSPDGFDIEMDGEYHNKKEVEKAIDEFIKRYEQQGYYSSNNGRIELSDLKDSLTITQNA